MVTLTLMPIEHVPVLATELLDILDPHPGETAIDCTFGGGGHAQEIAERLGSGGTLIAIDRDPEAVAWAATAVRAAIQATNAAVVAAVAASGAAVAASSS